MQVFNADIRNLLSMEEMWKGKDRIPPVPLDFDKIGEGSFSLPSASRANVNSAETGKMTNGSASANASGTIDVPSKQGLRDQKKLSLQESLVLFVSR